MRRVKAGMPCNKSLEAVSVRQSWRKKPWLTRNTIFKELLWMIRCRYYCFTYPRLVYPKLSMYAVMWKGKENKSSFLQHKVSLTIYWIQCSWQKCLKWHWILYHHHPNLLMIPRHFRLNLLLGYSCSLHFSYIFCKQ